MNTHEFQAKEILKNHGIEVPPFAVVADIKQVSQAVEKMGLDSGVVKVQVHAGGRGKAGGVKLCKTRESLLQEAENLIGMRVVNNQTGKEGIVADSVMITPLTKFVKEYYIGAIIDRASARAVLMLSPEGGVDIEEVASKTPEKILTVPIPLNGAFRSYHLIEMIKFMGWTGDLAKKGMKLIRAFVQAFEKTDASLLEINPLVQTKDQELIALDAKLTVDDNALYRQKEIAAFFDPTQIGKNEALAHKYELAYVALDGKIGCMVNGAGLAMATMDMIHHFGGEPANFLDVGGSATAEKVAEGFKIILSDPKVSAILVNIFGGIMNCVTLAEGIISAASELKLEVPLVVRMEGTNVEQGKKMLEDSGLNITIASSLTEAAKTVVKGGSCANTG